MSLLSVTQTVSPVTQFDAHELTASLVGMVSDATVPPSMTSRWTPVVVPVQLPFGTYAVTPSAETRTDIEPVGRPHEAITGADRHVPATHEDPFAQGCPQAPQLFGSDWVLTQRPLHSVCFALHDVSLMQAPILHT
jgi:hypothetical protein